MATIVYESKNNALWLQRECTGNLEFLGCHDLTDLTRPQGEVTLSYQRSGKNQFDAVAAKRAIPEPGTATVTLYRQTVNLIDELPCPFSLLVYYSNCGVDEDPTNFDFIDILGNIDKTEITQANVVNQIGADGETAPGGDVLQEISLQFRSFSTIKPLLHTDLTLAALTGRIIADISVCDTTAECGDCDDPTVGCQTLWIITNGSPGFYGDARIFKSVDGGTSWTEQTNSMTIDSDNLSAVDCSGDVVVIGNGDTAEYQFTNDGGTTWTLVTTPDEVINDIFVLSPVKIWMAADNGNIYFSDDKGTSIVTQDDGVATAENLNSIHFSDSLQGYAVGDSNAFVTTTDGGTSWSAGTGPIAAVNLNVVRAVPNSDIVFVGGANGILYRSTDKGVTWTTVLDGSTGTAPFGGGVSDIAICECNRVLVSGNNTDGLGAIRGSIDGGNTFTTVATASITGAESITSLTCCDINTYFGVGDDGTIFKQAGESFRDTD
ncbi:MAG: sialidase family protein [Planctomycetota bacterium]|jgi:photosystem II stability/assembly factor-like uncharacterized protein